MARRGYDVPGPWDDDEKTTNWTERMKAEAAELERLLETSKSLPAGEIVGAILRFQKGDGYALYRVEKEKPLTLAWIPFGDCWSISDAEMRGLRLDDVRKLVASERRLSALFGRSKFKMKEG